MSSDIHPGSDTEIDPVPDLDTDADAGVRTGPDSGRLSPDTDPPETVLAVLGGLAVLAVPVAFHRLVGPIGVGVGLVLAICWYTTSAEATVALGNLFLVVVVPANPPIEGVVLVEAALLGTLIGAVPRVAALVRTTVAFLVSLAGLLAIAWATLEWTDAIWSGTLVLVSTVALVAYGLHRYGLVRTRLVDAEAVDVE